MGLCASVGHVVNDNRVDITHFKILSTIGKGGFGKVKIAKDRKERLSTKGKKAKSHRGSMYTRQDTFYAIKFQDLRTLIEKERLWTNAWREREVMSKAQSPFVMNMKYAFVHGNDLLFVMPFLRGGDLGYYLERGGKMKEEFARFYAAEIFLGLKAIHAMEFVYRDLKLENCLLDAEGHVLLSDFGLAAPLNKLDKLNSNKPFEERYPAPHHLRTRGCAGTPGYIAPEVINQFSYDYLADFFTLGATIARMISLRTPFKPKLMDRKQVHKGDFPTPKLPSRTSQTCRDLITRLCRFDDKARLGFENLWEDVEQHPWFVKAEDFDWKNIAERRTTPPMAPNLKELNFNPVYAAEEQIMGMSRKPLNTEEKKKVENVFKGIDYNLDPPF
mmetsp:Transcript_31919/g.77788  ORF Transcript_31919/g.77788 Transcript_31919/m.77788 type:complete len:387 (-) Transcript_31919:126-1286(-)